MSQMMKLSDEVKGLESGIRAKDAAPGDEAEGWSKTVRLGSKG
jgi:hypothetical protein